MKFFHISFHIGCIRTVNALFRDLGHTVDFLYARQHNIPYTITPRVADSVWEKYKDEWNQYDGIITSDTAALSYIFLRNLSEVKPKLYIWVSHRFDYAMSEQLEYYDLIRKVSQGSDYLNKVKIIPYSDYERIYCGEKKIRVREPTLQPYGKVSGTKIFNGQIDDDKPLVVDTSGMFAPKNETVFISFYHNDNGFLPLKNILKEAGISVAGGEFRCIEDLAEYKCIITIPDAFSKFFAFELLHIHLPVFLPSEEFFYTLNRAYRIDETGKYNQCNFSIHTNHVPNEYLNLCEWYRFGDTRIFFDSIDDLVVKLRSFNTEKRNQVVEKLKKASEYHSNLVLSTARYLFE